MGKAAGIAGFVLALALTGCGSSSKSSSSATYAPATSAAAASVVDTGSASPPASIPAANAVNATRALVVTATINVQVVEVRKATGAAIALAEAAGGELFGQDSTQGQGAGATLVVKVPPAKVQSTLDNIGALGKEQGRTVKSDDITGQVVDLASRIATAEASVERLRGFLAKATTSADVSALEGELTQRETALEQLRGQQRTLDAQVVLATITVSFNVPAPHKDPVRDLPGVGPALRGGLHALWYTVRVVMVVILAAAPLTLAIGALLWAGWRIWRRRRRRRSPPADPSSPAPGERELVDQNQ